MLNVTALSGFGGAKAAYKVPFSGDFENGESDYLAWTPSDAATSDKTITRSIWFKRENSSLSVHLYNHGGKDVLSIPADNHMDSNMFNEQGTFSTTATFTDTDWHHVCVREDTTDSTSNLRRRLYVDGTIVSSFDIETYPDEDDTFLGLLVNGAAQHISHSSESWDGLIAEAACCDGQSYGPENFISPGGSPLDLSGLTFGNHGWWLDFATLGTDISGNGNNFTNNGVTQSSDVPT